MELIWEGLLDALRLIAARDPQTFQIAGRSLLVSGLATALAAAIGLPLGAVLALGALPGRRVIAALVNTGMGLPPVVVGLGVSIVLWRSGPLGGLALLYTPTAMILAQCIVAAPIATGLTASALGALDRELVGALRADGAAEWRVGWELLRAARPQVLVAVAAAFGRAVSEVGASLMVGGNILNQTRILTTTIALETGRGDFARAIALGIILLALAFAVNGVLAAGRGTGGG